MGSKGRPAPREPASTGPGSIGCSRGSSSGCSSFIRSTTTTRQFSRRAGRCRTCAGRCCGRRSSASRGRCLSPQDPWPASIPLLPVAAGRGRGRCFPPGFARCSSPPTGRCRPAGSSTSRRSSAGRGSASRTRRPGSIVTGRCSAWRRPVNSWGNRPGRGGGSSPRCRRWKRRRWLAASPVCRRHSPRRRPTRAWERRSRTISPGRRN